MKIFLFSILYKFVRFLVTKILYLIQNISFQPKDLEPAIKIGDIGLTILLPIKKLIYNFNIPKNIGVEVYGLKFKSPLIGSSFKSDQNIISIWLRMGLGSAILKTIMKEKRLGNNRPRIQETNFEGNKCLINALGLPGIGIDQFSIKLSHSKIWNFKRPIGISIGGHSKEDYIENIKTIEEKIDLRKKSYFYELNVSCPNTVDGKTLGDNPIHLDSTIREIRKFINTPISIKVSPDSSNIILNSIGDVCRSNEQIIINAGNSQFKTSMQVNLDPNNLSKKGGGLSGKSIFNRTLEMVKIFSVFGVPIIATGGIDNFDQIRILKKEGAILFGMATSLILNPYCIPKINSALKNV